MRDAAAPRKSSENASLPKGILALLVLIGILFLIQFSVGSEKGFVKGAKTQKESQQEDKEVAAAKERLQGTIDEQLDAIKKQVVSLDPQDVMQSSPEVQKIITDLKNLQGVPKNEVKNVCENICKSL